MTWPKTISVDFLIKLIGIVFGAGVLYAGTMQKIDDKVDKDTFTAESAFVHSEFRSTSVELQLILAQLQMANLRLKEICDVTRAGCR